MWKLLLISVLCVIMDTQGAGTSKRYVSTGGYVGSSTGAGAGGYAGGFAGGFAGASAGGFPGTDSDTDTDNDSGVESFVGTNTDDYADYDSTGFGYAPDFGLSAGFLDPYEFHQQLTAQIHAQHAAQQNALVKTSATDGSSVTAEASLLPDDNLIQRQVAAQKAYFDAVRRRNYYSNKGYKTNRYAPNYASASGSVGPGGYYQSAVISPANPGVPNVVNRFSTSSGPGGYKGVSVSSYSSSADVNGKRTGVRGAQTTVNDNGKVTTYSVHS